jgi:hypothetical protein
MQAAPHSIEVWESADIVTNAPGNAVLAYHRNAYSIVPLTLKHQGLQSLAHLVRDPLLDRTFGARMTGRGLVADGANALRSAKPGREFELTIATHTEDRRFLGEELIPMAKAVLRYYDARFQRDPNGKLIVSPTQAVETYWHGVVNDTPSMAGLIDVCERLLQVPASKADRDFWRRMKAWNVSFKLHATGGPARQIDRSAIERSVCGRRASPRKRNRCCRSTPTPPTPSLTAMVRWLIRRYHQEHVKKPVLKPPLRGPSKKKPPPALSWAVSALATQRDQASRSVPPTHVTAGTIVL